jgi:Raf kinase inhibitor-like YbhB/YbcL family protein
MALGLRSVAFVDGDRIPVRHTCDGADGSPPLTWSGTPRGTGSFVLICRDPDAPAGTWYHWAVFDIPPDFSALPAALAKTPRIGTLRQALNDFRRPGWGGPCPPRGHGLHHYQFRLLALAATALALPADVEARRVEAAADGLPVLAEARLTGVYSR